MVGWLACVLGCFEVRPVARFMAEPAPWSVSVRSIALVLCRQYIARQAIAMAQSISRQTPRNR